MSERPEPRFDPPAHDPGRLWAIVLLSGQGAHLHALIPPIDDEPPTRLAELDRSTLGRTLKRVALGIPPTRTVVVVTGRDQAKLIAEALGEAPAPAVLVQPHHRGTAASVLLPAHWIERRDPTATVAVFPSDHFIGNDGAFMRHVTAIAAAVSQYRGSPGWLVLLGAEPTAPDSDYGWIEPGDMVASFTGGRIREVRRFWEKPALHAAQAAYLNCWLWNTSIFVARVATLVDLGRQFLPSLHEQLAAIPASSEAEVEDRTIRRAYGVVSKADFARAVLERCPSGLVVSSMPRVGWCD